MHLNDYMREARGRQQAIGHFNFATADVLRAIVVGARRAGASCVMVGTSEKEADFIGITEAVALVRALEKELSFPIFLNADHFKSVERCTMAIDAGYDSVIIDTSRLSYEENVAAVQAVVAHARACGRPVTVEGELGYLKGASQVQEEISISAEDYTQPAQAADFIAKTGVDRLAVVFGNIHGIVTKQEEKLDIEHFSRIIAAAPQPFYVLHGASGLPDEQIKAAIAAGVSNVHFNTELRVAYQKELKEELAENPDETTPYKYLADAAAAVEEIVERKTRIFTNS
ncbi:MAG: class II fructose-bisphosphate aldolase [Patescibacteria group bacterium]